MVEPRYADLRSLHVLRDFHILPDSRDKAQDPGGIV